MTSKLNSSQIHLEKSSRDTNDGSFKNIKTKKYLLDLGNNEKAEILYPVLPNYNNQYDVNSNFIKNVFIMVDPTKFKEGPIESLCKSLLGLFTDVIFDTESQEFKIIIQGFVPNGACYRHKRLKMGMKMSIFKKSFFFNLIFKI